MGPPENDELVIASFGECAVCDGLNGHSTIRHRLRRRNVFAVGNLNFEIATSDYFAWPASCTPSATRTTCMLWSVAAWGCSVRSPPRRREGHAEVALCGACIVYHVGLFTRRSARSSTRVSKLGAALGEECSRNFPAHPPFQYGAAPIRGVAHAADLHDIRAREDADGCRSAATRVDESAYAVPNGPE